MEAQCGALLEPLGVGLGHPATSLCHAEPHVTVAGGPAFDPRPSPASNSALSTPVGSTPLHSASTSVTGEEEEEECLVDSQPICFSENPFLVANRKGKGRPPQERVLSGPPVGYGRKGQLQPWLFNKASGPDKPVCGV